MIFHTIFYKPCKEGGRITTCTKTHKKACQTIGSVVIWALVMRRDGRVVEGARLESVYMVTPYQGFESLSLRHILNFLRPLLSKKSLITKGVLSFFIQVCPTLSVYIRIKRGHIRGHKLNQH